MNTNQVEITQIVLIILFSKEWLVKLKFAKGFTLDKQDLPSNRKGLGWWGSGGEELETTVLEQQLKKKKRISN